MRLKYRPRSVIHLARSARSLYLSRAPRSLHLHCKRKSPVDISTRLFYTFPCLIYTIPHCLSSIRCNFPLSRLLPSSSFCCGSPLGGIYRGGMVFFWYFGIVGIILTPCNGIILTLSHGINLTPRNGLNLILSQSHFETMGFECLLPSAAVLLLSYTETEIRPQPVRPVVLAP